VAKESCRPGLSEILIPSSIPKMDFALLEADATRHVTAERIDVVDVLRGLAVLGMAWVHVVSISQEQGGALSLWTEWLVRGQARTLFTILFGVSFALQSTRSQDSVLSRRGFVSMHVRRMVILWALFGLACDAWLGNDILIDYAIFGLALPLVQSWRRSALLLVIAGCFIVPRLRPAVEQRITSPWWAEQRAEWVRENSTDDERMRPALKAVALRQMYMITAARDARHLLRWRPYVYRLYVLGLMLVGFLVVREGVLTSLDRHRRRIVLFGCISAALWGLSYAPNLPVPSLEGDLGRAVGGGLGLLFTGWLALAYGSFVLAVWGGPFAVHRIARRWLRTVAPLGRMALTWFVLHQLLLRVLFTPLGANMTVPQGSLLVVWVVMGTTMIATSSAWLRVMRQGPFEWTWRLLAGLRWVPMLRTSSSKGNVNLSFAAAPGTSGQ
jgi:uncharacterized protein